MKTYMAPHVEEINFATEVIADVDIGTESGYDDGNA